MRLLLVYAKMTKKIKNTEGIALISLLFFVLIAMIYISAAVVIMAVNSQATTTTQEGLAASRIAEGALEDTLLRLLRDPDYSGGTFNLDGGNVTVSIVGDGLKDVTVSVIRDERYYRKFIAQVQFMETEMTILSWREAF